MAVNHWIWKHCLSALRGKPSNWSSPEVSLQPNRVPSASDAGLFYSAENITAKWRTLEFESSPFHLTKVSLFMSTKSVKNDNQSCPRGLLVVPKARTCLMIVLWVALTHCRVESDRLSFSGRRIILHSRVLVVLRMGASSMRAMAPRAYLTWSWRAPASWATS